MRGKGRFWLAFIVVLALLISTMSLALAHVEGEPELEATVMGSSEFQVGQGGALQITLQNKGTFSGKMEDPDDEVMALGYLSPIGVTLVPPCTTAVGITATLESKSPSIGVLSGAVAVGTLSSGMSTMQPITFQIGIAQDVEPGIYLLDLALEYEYLEDVDWLNPPEDVPPYEPEFEFHWGTETEIETIPIRVVGTYFSVTDIETEGIRVGATGIITATIENSGVGEATEVTAELVTALGGSFAPVDRATFLGDINGGDSVTTEFKISVSEEAIAKTSPLDMLIEYRDENGVPRQTLITVGVPVEEELEFEIEGVETESELTTGAEAVISLYIKNTSNCEARDVLARINVIDPFTSTDETSHVGTLQAGEAGTAKFRISVDGDALPKAYALDVVVKYWDSQGNSYTSKPMKVTLEVIASSGFSWLTVALIIAAIAVIAGLGYYLLVGKRRKRAVTTKR